MAQSGFDKAGYYKVMESGDPAAIDQQIKKIENAEQINKEAYTGALLMKKASLVKGAAKKLNIFKDGHKKLEAAIEKDNSNTEWRFLRLIIQEHAPKIVNYRSDISKDAAAVQAGFKKLAPEIQSAILDYKKNSASLQSLQF